MRKVVIHVVLPLAILTAGSLAVAGLLGLRAKTTSQTVRPEPPLVQLLEVHAVRLASTVRTTGVVVPARRVTIAPDVTGRVVARSPALVPGGRVSRGEMLVRLEDQRYRVARAKARSQLAQARLQLAQEQALGQVARQSWPQYGDDRPLSEVPVASRQPHAAAAQSALEAAEANLQQTQRDLAATVVRAPWNALVVQASGDVGQLAGPGSPVAELVGTDRVWVMASLPVSRLDQLQIPGMNADVGSPAQVITGAQEGSPLRRRGRILRLSGQLDPATRSAKVVVVVDNPFDVPAKALPLLPGSFVDVELEGEEEQVIPIPQAALHERTQVWLVNGQLELEERTVAIGWRNEGQAYVTEGLTGGERLVISPLASPRAGLRVRAEPLLTRVESGR